MWVIYHLSPKDKNIIMMPHTVSLVPSFLVQSSSSVFVFDAEKQHELTLKNSPPPNTRSHVYTPVAKRVLFLLAMLRGICFLQYTNVANKNDKSEETC